MVRLFLVGVFLTAISSLEAGEPRTEFTRMLAHWSQYGDQAYLDFIDEVQPEQVQLGFYGGHFWSLAHTPSFGGYPAHFPVQGIDECGKWFRQRNADLRKRKVKVIGHFNVEFLVGEPDGPEGPQGFFRFYRDLWDEKILGPKPPVEDPLDFLEKDKNGDPLVKQSYSIGGMHEYFACLRNPHWQTVLKAWVTRGIELGVDGFIANYFYRHDCHCEHCQKGFRDYLAEHHDADGLKKLGIADLQSHVFDEIVCWHKPEESTPLRREMLRWSQISNKQVFDEVFVRHGRALKSDLIVAQWNHLSDFSAISGDERCLLPAEMWGRDEDYLWYSMGGSGVHTDIANGVLADGTLQARYIRGTFDDKPYVLGKYESVRTRVAIAELAANGGAPMGFYARFSDPDVREVFKNYFGFLKRYQDLYHANLSHAEIALVFPRKAIHEGNLAPLAAFKELGRELLAEHRLFDIIADDLPDFAERSANYTHVLHALDSPSVKGLGPHSITAPPTVHVSANIPAHNGEIDLHFVNYDREEFPPNPKNGKPVPGKGPADENPIPLNGIQVAYLPPEGMEITSVEFITPEKPEPQVLVLAASEGRVQFTVPEFLVYGVARMKTQPVGLANAPVIGGVTTVYHHNSHSDMIFSRITETDSLDGQGAKPEMKIHGIYVDQFPENDTARAHSEKYGWSLVDSIEKALVGKDGKLAVDGVLLLAEHGDYEVSDTTQVIWPKRRMFGEIVDVFKKTGKVVPVFCDKHLADNWQDAKWIYDQSKEMNFPMMAGSSVPGLWRYPATDVRRDAKLQEIVGISYHTLDAYGFHGLEVIQSLAERRAGGETGVKRVRCLTGADVWTSDLYNRELFEAALSRQENQKRVRRKPLEEIVAEPVLFVIDYRDGLRASMLTLNGAAGNWTAAWRYADASSIDSTLFWTQEERPFFHFALFTDAIEKMIHTGKPTWPVERTLMTSGLLDACLISKRDGGDWLDTPYLDFDYRSEWNWRQPPPPPRGRLTREQ